MGQRVMPTPFSTDFPSSGQFRHTHTGQLEWHVRVEVPRQS